MAVYKEPKTNTWRVIYRYTDWNGERKQSQKRGFQTKREAQSWEREQLNKLGSDLDMTFRSFVEHYEEDRRSRIKDSTWESKEHIIRTKLGWETVKTPRRFYGVPWPEQCAIIFDLTKIAPPRTRTPNLSAEDMLRAYELAEKGSLLPVSTSWPSNRVPFASAPPSSVIEAQ